jgi:hypothetical protein
MAESQLPISFDGFGSIPSSKPSFAQGIGRDGSFAPIWTVEPKMPPRYMGSSSGRHYPWDVTLTRSGNSGPYTGTIYPGSVAGIIPSNIFNTFTVDSSLTYWIGNLTTDGRKVTGATISTSQSSPPPPTLIPSSLPSLVQFVFALSSNGKVWRTIGQGNPNISSQIVVVTDKTTSPPPGTPGVDRWYNLIVN